VANPPDLPDQPIGATKTQQTADAEDAAQTINQGLADLFLRLGPPPTGPAIAEEQS
jgi:hypothetical protein